MGELDLISESSLWAEARFLDDVEAHESALSEAGFERGAMPVGADTSGFHPGGDVWGQHLTSDARRHTWAVVRVANRMADPNARDPEIGGIKPRYSVEIHSVPKDPRSAGVRPSVTPIWEGSDIRKFLSGVRSASGAMTWPDVQRSLKLGPRGR